MSISHSGEPRTDLSHSLLCTRHQPTSEPIGAGVSMVTIPAAVVDINPEWLTEVLRSATASELASVTGVTARALGGAESLASDVVRLSLEYGPGVPGPADLVAKLPSTLPPEREGVFARRGYQREADFYRELAASAGVVTPRCYYAAHRAEEQRYCVILEYLASGTFRSDEEGASADQLLRAARGLAAMHARWWESLKLGAYPWLNAVAGTPLLPRLPAALPVFFERFEHLVPAHLREAVLTITEWAPRVAARVASSGVTLVHGDCSVKNLFFPDNPTAPVVAFDWSLVGRGPAARDLVNLVVVSMKPEVRRAAERPVIRAYHDALVEGGVTTYSYDDLWEDYQRSTLLRLHGPIVNAAGPREEWWRTAGRAAARVLAAIDELDAKRLT